MHSTSRRSTLAPRRRWTLLAASLVAAQIAAVSPVVAQTKGAAPAGAADDTKKALDLFKKGQGLWKANKFSEALTTFRESYALVQSPNSRFYIARCLAGTGDTVGAYLEFEAVIADIDARNEAKYVDTRANAVSERDEVAAKISLLTVNVLNPQPGTRLTVAGRDVPREAWAKAIPLTPGMTDVSVTTVPNPPISQPLDLKAGEKRTFDIDANKAAAPPPPPPGGGSSSRGFLRPVAYVAGGVGVAGFVMFGVAGALATSTYSDLDSKCSKGTGTRACPSDLQGKIDEGKLQKDVANAGLIIGAVGLAAGVTLFVLSRDSGPKKDEGPKVQSLVVGPSRVSLEGTF